MTPKGSAKRQKTTKMIAVAGEGDFDRTLLQHLIPAILPAPCPKVALIKEKTNLHKAESQLSPRLDKIRRLAQALAAKYQAELVGVVIHVDLDDVLDDRYHKLRERLCSEMSKALPWNTAIALAAYEMEAWLMLFPEAFPKVRPGWRLSPDDARRDLANIVNAKEHLKRRLGNPPYRESDAPKVMAAAVEHGLVVPRPRGNNRSYTDFVEEIGNWSSIPS